MKMIVRDEFLEPCPPPWLSTELLSEYSKWVDRLRASGAELCDVDSTIIARTVLAEQALQRAQEAAAEAPVVIESPSNGQLAHPVHRHVMAAEANLRAWLKLLPRGSGGRGTSLPPHVTPTPAPASGDVAEPPGQPSERLQRLRAIIAQFQADQASTGAAAGDGAAGGVAGAAGAGGCVDAAGGGAE